jgi:hypothetical protein
VPRPHRRRRPRLWSPRPPRRRNSGPLPRDAATGRTDQRKPHAGRLRGRLRPPEIQRTGHPRQIRPQTIKPVDNSRPKAPEPHRSPTTEGLPQPDDSDQPQPHSPRSATAGRQRPAAAGRRGLPQRDDRAGRSWTTGSAAARRPAAHRSRLQRPAATRRQRPPQPHSPRPATAGQQRPAAAGLTEACHSQTTEACRSEQPDNRGRP